jgi:hypothetical protein
MCNNVHLWPRLPGQYSAGARDEGGDDGTANAAPEEGTASEVADDDQDAVAQDDVVWTIRAGASRVAAVTEVAHSPRC